MALAKRKVYRVKLGLFLVLILNITSFSAEPGLMLYLECDEPAGNCIQRSFAADSSDTLLLKREPEMVIGKEDVKEAALLKSEFGEKNLIIRLKKEATEEFAQLTENNLSKPLALVVGGQIIIAPRILSVITEGSLQISSTIGDENSNYLDHLPWLREMVEEKEERDKLLEHISMALLILLGIFILAGCVYFGFLKKSKV